MRMARRLRQANAEVRGLRTDASGGRPPAAEDGREVRRRHPRRAAGAAQTDAGDRHMERIAVNDHLRRNRCGAEPAEHGPDRQKRSENQLTPALRMALLLDCVAYGMKITLRMYRAIRSRQSPDELPRRTRPQAPTGGRW